MSLRPILAEAARRELAAWENSGAARVAEGKLSQSDLDFNRAAWSAIADLLEHGRAETSLGWDDLDRAAEASLTRREEARNINQDPERHPALQARYEAVWSIRRALADERRRRDALTAMTDQLRAGVKGKAVA